MKRIKSNNAFVNCIKIFFKNNLLSNAAEMAYYLVFAFFPLLMVVHASFSMVIRNFDIRQTVFYSILPKMIEELVDTYIEHISSNSNISFMILGVFLTLYTLSSFMKSMKRSVIKVYGFDSKATTLYDWILSFVFSLLILAAFYLSLIILVLGGYILDIIGTFIGIPDIPVLATLVRVLFTAFVVFSVVFIIYYNLPGVKQKPVHVLVGSALTASGWIIVTSIFTFYMNHFSRYSIIYGSIGAFIILLLWIYISCIILLSGMVINAVLYKRSERK